MLSVRARVLMRRSEITSIAELDLEFEVDDVDEYTDNTSAFAMEARKTPLKRDAGGNVIKVTEGNKMEYLQLYVQHRSVCKRLQTTPCLVCNPLYASPSCLRAPLKSTAARCVLQRVSDVTASAPSKGLLVLLRSRLTPSKAGLVSSSNPPSSSKSTKHARHSSCACCWGVLRRSMLMNGKQVQHTQAREWTRTTRWQRGFGRLCGSWNQTSKERSSCSALDLAGCRVQASRRWQGTGVRGTVSRCRKRTTCTQHFLQQPLASTRFTFQSTRARCSCENGCCMH